MIEDTKCVVIIAAQLDSRSIDCPNCGSNQVIERGLAEAHTLRQVALPQQLQINLMLLRLGSKRSFTEDLPNFKI